MTPLLLSISLKSFILAGVNSLQRPTVNQINIPLDPRLISLIDKELYNLCSTYESYIRGILELFLRAPVLKEDYLEYLLESAKNLNSPLSLVHSLEDIILRLLFLGDRGINMLGLEGRLSDSDTAKLDNIDKLLVAPLINRHAKS